MIYLVIFLAIVLFLLFCHYENNKIDTTYYNIKSKDAGKNFKIAHLSDFHSKPFKSILEKLVNEKPVKALLPSFRQASVPLFQAMFLTQ